MTIHFDSWQSVVGFLALLGAGCTAHWMLFAAPLLRKILAPYGDRLDAVTRVIRLRYPAEYADAQTAIQEQREMRNAI